MILHPQKFPRAFALLWVMLSSGAIGILALGMGLWVWIEAQRDRLHTLDMQTRFAAQTVLRHVLGDIQTLLGPDTRVVRAYKNGHYVVFDSGVWDPKAPLNLKQIGVVGIPDEHSNEPLLHDIKLGDGRYVCTYKYKLRPGWDMSDTVKEIPKPKRILANVRRGGLCKALDKQEDWALSNALIWDDRPNWPSVPCMGATRGQVYDFFHPTVVEGEIVPQAGGLVGQKVLPQPGQNTRNFKEQIKDRPLHYARYARPVEIRLDCYLEVESKKTTGTLFGMVSVEPKITCINPYDVDIGVGHYVFELTEFKKNKELIKLFESNVYTPLNIKDAPTLIWAMSGAGKPRRLITMEGAPQLLVEIKMQYLSTKEKVNFPKLKNKNPIKGQDVNWQLGTLDKDACELESMNRVPFYWYPDEKCIQRLQGLTIDDLLQMNKPLYIGFFTTTENLADNAPTALNRQVWAPSNLDGANNSNQNRWNVLNTDYTALTIPTFANPEHLPRSLMDLIHWGEWNPHQWAQGMPFNAVCPEGCPKNDYSWMSKENDKIKLLDIAWMMNETLLDGYYLSTQEGLIKASKPNMNEVQEQYLANYGLNVNDNNVDHWVEQLEKFIKDPQQAKLLAEECVKQLDKRNVFMGIADFVNRSLIDDEQGECGAFEAACKVVGIASQEDRLELIAQLLPHLRAREDAWEIEIEVAMREAGSKKTQVRKTFRVWVQRELNYVDGRQGDSELSLSDLNDQLGRRWCVVGAS